MGGTSTDYYTLDEALLAVGFGKYQVLVLAYAGLGWAAEAMEIMLLSFVGPAVRAQWSISESQESLITTVVFAGMLIGALSWGLVSDHFGRRRGFLFTALVMSGAGLLSALAPSYIWMIVLRFVVGVGLGGGHVLASWFLEFIPASNRGTWMIIFSFFWALGTIFESSLAWAVMPALGWRWLLALSSVPSFFLLLFFGATPESPRYLCKMGRTSDALLVLDSMATVNNTSLPPGILLSSARYSKSRQEEDVVRVPLTTNEVSLDSETETETETETGGLKALYWLLSPKLIRSTLLLWTVFFGNAFGYYGVVLLTSTFSDKNGRCVSNLVQPNQLNDTNLYKDVFLTSFAEVPGLVVSAVTVDRAGRKVSIWAMLFLCCGFLLPLLVHQNEAITTILLFGARTCVSASFNILYIYTPEIYPTSVRSTGLGIGSAIGRIGGMVCPLVAVGLVGSCQQLDAILLFELVIFVTGLATLLFPLETKGRYLSEQI